LSATGFEVETMMNIRAHRIGLRVAEVPSFEHRRIHGVGRLQTIPDGIRVLKTIFAERLRRLAGEGPLRGLTSCVQLVGAEADADFLAEPDDG